MKPLITVIVPVYNVSKYIEQCLNSLINQTMKELAIVVVDDCGTDDSIGKAQKIASKDKRIQIVYNKTNQGLAESRNIGLQYVQTPYVAFLDSDDWVSDDYYQKLYKRIQETTADIAVSDVIYYYNEKRKTREWVSTWNFKSGADTVTSPEEKQYNIYACACWNKLYATKLFTKHNLKFPKGLYIEDVPITFISTMLADRITLVRDAHLFYRMRSDSIMGVSGTDRKPFDIFSIYAYTDMLWRRLKNFDKTRDYRKILDNFKIFNTFSWYQKVHPMYKDEFWSKMRDDFIKMNLKNNKFISNETQDIYNQVCSNKRILRKTYIRLFGLIPLFKLLWTENSFELHLLNSIPFYKVKIK